MALTGDAAAVAGFDESTSFLVAMRTWSSLVAKLEDIGGPEYVFFVQCLRFLLPVSSHRRARVHVCLCHRLATGHGISKLAALSCCHMHSSTAMSRPRAIRVSAETLSGDYRNLEGKMAEELLHFITGRVHDSLVLLLFLKVKYKYRYDISWDTRPTLPK